MLISNNQIKIIVIILLSLCIVVSVNGINSGENLEKNLIYGNVTAETGNGTIPIENAIVQGLDENNNVVDTVSTNIRGTYSFRNDSISKLKIIDKGHKTNHYNDSFVIYEDYENETSYDEIKNIQDRTKQVQKVYTDNIDFKFSYPEDTYITDQMNMIKFKANKTYDVVINSNFFTDNPEYNSIKKINVKPNITKPIYLLTEPETHIFIKEQDKNKYEFIHKPHFHNQVGIENLD